MTPTDEVPVTDVRLALFCRSATDPTAWIDGQTLWTVGTVDPVAGAIEGDLYLAVGRVPNTSSNT